MSELKTAMNKIDFIKNNLSIKTLLSKMGIYPNKSGFIFSIYKQEKTPSLRIYEDNNSFYCFSTSQGGDVLKFYKDYYRLTTEQAINDLYKLIGGENIAVRYDPVIPKSEDKKDFKSCLLDHEKYLFEEVAAISSEQYALIEVKKARLENNKKIFQNLYEYCQRYSNADSFKRYMNEERMLSDETIRRFKIFYIENYFEVNQHLKKTFQPEELFASGLVNEKGNLIFAKHRIIIPYLHKGEIIYLRGRYFDAGETKTNGPKYIGLKNDALNVNTAKRLWNTDVFNNMVNGDRLFITEGEFDAMVLEQEGLFACAIPGVGNIPGNKWFLKMKGLRVNLMMDNDEAGESLRKNLHKKFDSIGIDYYDLYLSNYKDITDFARDLYASKN